MDEKEEPNARIKIVQEKLRKFLIRIKINGVVQIILFKLVLLKNRHKNMNAIANWKLVVYQ